MTHNYFIVHFGTKKIIAAKKNFIQLMDWYAQELVDSEKIISKSSLKSNLKSKHWRMTMYTHLFSRKVIKNACLHSLNYPLLLT